jgi:hypothetical protein
VSWAVREFLSLSARFGSHLWLTKTTARAQSARGLFTQRSDQRHPSRLSACADRPPSVTRKQELGAHRGDVPLNDDPAVCDLLRRAFWSLLVLDAELSGATGRPSHIAPGSYDAPMPVFELDGVPDPNVTALALLVEAAELLRKSVETMVRVFWEAACMLDADRQSAGFKTVLDRKPVADQDVDAPADGDADGRDRRFPIRAPAKVSRTGDSPLT